jgi:hypothetical protein
MALNTTKFASKRGVFAALLGETSGVTITGTNGTFTLPAGRAIIIHEYRTAQGDVIHYSITVQDADSFLAEVDAMPDSTPVNNRREEITPF